MNGEHEARVIVRTPEEITELREKHQLEEVRAAGWWAHDRGLTKH